MDWTSICQAVSGIVTAIISVVGFVYVLKQLKQLNNSIQGQSHSSIYQTGIQINQMFIENSELMPYLLGKKELTPGSTKFYKCIAISESALDYYEFIYLEKSRIDANQVKHWEFYMKAMFSSNKVMQDYLAKYRDSYDNEFVAMLEAAKRENEVG